MERVKFLISIARRRSGETKHLVTVPIRMLFLPFSLPSKLAHHASGGRELRGLDHDLVSKMLHETYD